MKAYSVYHKTDRSLTPMIIITEEVPLVVAKRIFDTSEGLPLINKEDLVSNECDKARLDPGGMFFAKISDAEFILQGVLFNVQLSKVDYVHELAKRASERTLGYMRFKNWFNNVVLPVRLHKELVDKLAVLRYSDECLHAGLDEEAVKDGFEKGGFLIRKIPREK